MASISFLHPDPDSDTDHRHLHSRRHRNHLNNHHKHHHHHSSSTLSSVDPYFPIFSSPSSSSNPHSSPLHEPTNFNIGALDEYDDVSDPESVILAGPHDLLDRENQVSFVMDLFQQRVEQSHVLGGRPPRGSLSLSDSLNESGFGVIDENPELGIDGLELDLGLGFGLDESHDNSVFQDVDPIESNRDLNRDYSDNIVIDDDDFFVERRVSRVESCDAESAVCFHANPIRVVGFDSDSESEVSNGNGNLLAIDLNSGDEYGLEDHVNLGNGSHYDNEYGDIDDDNEDEEDDASVATPLCWDSLRLEDHRENNEDFEWEEVDGRVDEREVLSVFVDDEEAASVSLSISPIIAPEDMVSVERVGGLGNLEWEVLLDANNLGSNPDHDQDHNSEPYFGEHDDYIYTAEYETLFGQFAENEIAVMGRPPASKSVVDRLPCVVLTKDDVHGNNALCAVCKDEINVGETAKQLPCTHRYHGECILPWLGIRNTCPVCRFELPTDDADYERRKAQQRNGAVATRM
ncbi:hypothetical protein Tsubulata_039304 [Turnera subulata]|uniref:RING-type E3 ubiquitin transferase n=1 Tax=Turnera subulata TaxID=218843 RepID=A0A9Q0G7V0_9ROSI|nr:hypothetical protein Tsubulata_039304 [Turnera subulata]